MKNIIILKWDSLVLSIVSILYGTMLLFYPQILQGYQVYDSPPPPNTVWTFSLGMAALAFGIALKEG